MAWTNTFMTKYKKWWLKKIAKAKYYASNTGSWYEGTISEKSIDGDTISIKIQTSDDLNLTITSIRLYDTDGDIAYEGARSIVKSAEMGAMIVIDVPIEEE